MKFVNIRGIENLLKKYAKNHSHRRKRIDYSKRAYVSHNLITSTIQRNRDCSAIQALKKKKKAHSETTSTTSAKKTEQT